MPRRKKLEVKNPRLAPEVGFSDLDEKAIYLVGWPGYRNARSRSGLGYIGTQAEWAHMQGLMFRWLISGRFKTRNPVFLVFPTILGIANACPILLLFAGAEGRQVFQGNWVIFFPYTLVGLLILANVALSLIKCEKGESITGD